LLPLLVVLSVTQAHGQAVVYWPTVVPLVEAQLIAAGTDGIVVLSPAPGVYLSVQPDGRFETRTTVATWELATRIGTSVLRYDGAGTVRYVFIQDRAVVAPAVVPPVVNDPQPPNIRTTDAMDVLIRVVWWLKYFGHPEAADRDYWMGVIMDTLYKEGHAVGWTADDYWPGKMRDAYGEPTK